jgi:hypothetical protein
VTQIAAVAWAGRGKERRAAFGFSDDGFHIIILGGTAGEKFDLEFGSFAPSGNVYAGIQLDGEYWILEFPWIMFRDIEAYFPLKPHL